MREYIFGVLSVVWQEAKHNGNEEEIIERGINALMQEFKAAEHRVHRTAILFGFIGLGFGIVVGAWLVVVAQIAAR